MTKITSRDEPHMSDCIKVSLGHGSQYAPLEMTDKSVYELAQHWYTVEEIASFFNVSAETVLKHHGDAFRKGKLFHTMKPRILLDKMLTDIMNADVDYSQPGEQADVCFKRGKEIVELKWKKTESNVSEVAVAQVQPTGWTMSAPVIVKPTELTASEKAELAGEEEQE